MKTMLNISLILMVAAGSAGAANFISMYRSGDIDKIYTHENPAVAHQEAPTPVASTVNIYEPANGVQTVEPARIVASAMVEQPVEAVTTTLAKMEEDIVEEEILPVYKDDKPLLSEEEIDPDNKGVTTTITDAVTKEKVIEKKVGKKKFRLSMYSRAALWEPVEEEGINVTAPAGADTLSSKEAKAWDY